MTIEQIELRKILTQMLADNGINRETIKDFTKQVINEKVDRAIKDIVCQIAREDFTAEIKKKIEYYIKHDTADVIRNEVRGQIEDIFSNITVNFVDKRKE